MKRNKLYLLAALSIAIVYTSCTKDEPTPDPGPTPCTKINWYEDLDGDGQGNPDVTLYQCDQPDGYVEDNTDPIDMNVNRTQVPILVKFTGETCPPCGGWGWTAWENLYGQFPDNAFSWANYGAGFSNNHFRSQELTPTMDPIEDQFFSGGKPSFMANNTDHDQSSADAATEATNSLSNVPDVAGVLQASIEGDQLTLTAEVEFFADMSGDYVLGAYLVEDKPLGTQAGQTGIVEHHLVMRGSLTDGSAWGETIVTGGALAGDKHVKTFTATIPSTYKAENFSYGIIIWKKFTAAHVYVNAYTTQGQ